MTLPDDAARQAALETHPDAHPADARPPDARPADAGSGATPAVLRREPLHYVVIFLLIADIVFGLGLAVFAEKVLAFRPMAVMGCGLAALGLGVLAYFVLVGGGKDRRW